MEPISIIIPTYNRAEHLKRAVQSVICQDEWQGELIIIDDGSTDNTQGIINDIECSQPVVYRHCKNQGPAAARNLGIETAKYNFIAFLDSDDHWKKNKLKKQYRYLAENPEFMICHTGEKWLRNGTHLNQKEIHKPRNGNIFDHCLQLCAVGMSTVLIKKEVFDEIGHFDTTLPCCEDYDLWLRISSNYPFLLLNEPLTIKEGGREDQVSFIYRIGMDKFRIYTLQKLLNSKKLSNEQYGQALQELQKKCLVYGNGCIRHDRLEEGNRYLKIPGKYLK